MKTIETLVMTLGICGSLAGVSGCALNAANPGVPGKPDVKAPDVTGTVFTIVFENHAQSEVLKPDAPTFLSLSQSYGNANAYISSTHPSLPNYIEMTSGDKHGIANDNGPTGPNVIAGNDNLADQLDAAGVKWRAYMEDMGEPCKMESAGLYAVHHNPFVYYSSLAEDKPRCEEHVVDMAQHLDEDLAADKYDYVWITPNMCNNMHDCPPATADAWLKTTVDKLMASPGYKAGGAIFILFDEGSLRILGAAADLATIVVSDKLVSPGYTTDTRFDHASYLATLEDIFQMPRLPTTQNATPMDEFFVERTVVTKP